jgi:hypothetical protein
MSKREIYTMGYEQIQNNMELLKPGTTFKELTLNSKEYSKDEFRHYSVLFHGVGLCDEFPAIPFSWELMRTVLTGFSAWDGDVC